MDRFRKIAVFLPNWVGDVVMSTPALRALREHFAGIPIAYIGRKAAVDTLTGTSWANLLITDPSSRNRSGLSAAFALARRLRQERFDLAVLLPNSFRTALVAWMGRCRHRIGYSRDGRTFLLAESLDPPRDAMGYVPIAAIDYYNKLLALVGVTATDRRMELPLLPSDEMAAEALLRQSQYDPKRPLVMLNPGAAFGSSKLWHFRRYAALGDELTVRRGAQIILHAAPAEKQLAAKVAETMKYPPLVDFARRDSSLGLLKALLRRCRLLVTNDTGARHIAAAVGTPIVTIFGSTDPEWTTLNYARERIVRKAVPCSPCQQPLCPQSAGPQYHQCMTAIAVENVLTPALELMDQDARP